MTDGRSKPYEIMWEKLSIVPVLNQWLTLVIGFINQTKISMCLLVLGLSINLVLEC